MNQALTLAILYGFILIGVVAWLAALIASYRK